MNAIIVENLTKTYNNGKRSLKGVSFSVKKGEIFSLLGMNGAGKTTLINILTTYLNSTSGKALVFRKDCASQKNEIRSQIACVSQKVSVDDYLTLRENLIFQSRLYGLNKQELQKCSGELLKIFDLEDVLNKKVRECSGGMKRKMDILMSLIPYPQILFLDEPTVSLDIQSRKAMWELLKTIQRRLGTTIILTTHYLEEADLLSDTICFIKEGTIICQDTPENLKRFLRPNLIRVYLENRNKYHILQQELEVKSFVNSICLRENYIGINVVDCEKNIHEIAQVLLTNNMVFQKLEIVEPTLNDVFLSVMEERNNNHENI